MAKVHTVSFHVLMWTYFSDMYIEVVKGGYISKTTSCGLTWTWYVYGRHVTFGNGGYCIFLDITFQCTHCNGVIMGAMASQITSLPIVYSTVSSVADQGKHQSSVSLAFVRGIHRWPVNFPHKGPVTWKMFPFDNVIIHLQHFAIWRIIKVEYLIYLTNFS